MTDKKLVYIASPYTLGNLEGNVQRQIDTASSLMDQGFIAFAPLLNHYIHVHHPHSYEQWAEADMEMLRRCDIVLRLPGESKGADAEVCEARHRGIPVYYSLFELLLEE